MIKTYITKKYTNLLAVPFWIENVTNNDITVTFSNHVTAGTLQPSITNIQCTDDYKGWDWRFLGSLTTRSAQVTTTIPANSKRYFRANATYWMSFKGLKSQYTNITANGDFKVGGNIMSLLYGSSFDGTQTTLSANYAFGQLFYNSTNLLDASQLLMPATTLTNNCYASMFDGCSNLTAVSVDTTEWNTAYYNNWLANVSATGTFTMPTALDGVIPEDSTSGIPTGWTKVLK